jgi:hypothetical protein
MRAIQKAALNPTIHSDLYQEWVEKNGELPPEHVMRRYLEKELDFNPKSVDDFVREFTETLEFAGLLKGEEPKQNENVDNDGQEELDFEEVSTDIEANSTRTPSVTQVSVQILIPDVTSPNTRDFVFPVHNGVILLRIPHKLSQEEYTRFKKWLELIEYNILQGN